MRHKKESHFGDDTCTCGYDGWPCPRSEPLTPPGDRVEYWSWGGDSGSPTQYLDMVYVQDDTVRIKYNAFALVMRQAGYKKIEDPWNEHSDKV